MFQVNVTIGFNAETLAVLNTLLAGVVKPSKTPAGVAEKPSVANGKAAKVQPAVNGNAEEHEETGETGGEDTGDDTAVSDKVYTVEDIRAAAATKAKAGLKDEVKGLLTKMGAASVAALPAAKYGEFMKELELLKSQSN